MSRKGAQNRKKNKREPFGMVYFWTHSNSLEKVFEEIFRKKLH